MKRYIYKVGDIIDLLEDNQLLWDMTCTVDVIDGRGFQITVEPSGYLAPELLPLWSADHRDWTHAMDTIHE